MFLLVPDPSPVDPQLRGLWDWLQQKVEQCPSTLPDSVLSELVDTLLTRVHCSAASREEVIPIALALTESFMCQVGGRAGEGGGGEIRYDTPWRNADAYCAAEVVSGPVDASRRGSQGD